MKETIKKYCSKPSIRKYGNYEALLRGAEVALENYDFESAVLLSGEAIRKEPEDPSGYQLRGKALYNSMRGSDKAALKDFQKAAALGTKDGRVFEYLARVAFDGGDAKRAIEFMNKAIELQPGQRDFYRYRASIHHSLKDELKAEADYNQFVEVAPEKAFGYVLRARFYDGRGQYERALLDYEKAIALTEETRDDSKRLEKYALGLKGKALALRNLKRYKESVDTYTRLLQFKSEADETLRERGDVYLEMGKYKRAIEDYSRVIEMMPNLSRTALLSRAEAYEKLGEGELARADRKKARSQREAPAEKHVFDMKM